MTALSAPAPRRRIAAALVLAVYGALLSVGALSDLSHGAFHLLERLQERQARAAALGLAHLGDRSGYTHTHGGSTHTHAGAVSALLSAAEHADQEHADAVPVVKLSAHTPSVAAWVLILGSIDRAYAAGDRVAPERPHEMPPLPPPRG